MTPPITASQNPPGSMLDHKQLPESDGSIVENFIEQPQNELLTGCLRPRLKQRSPNGQFVIGHDSGIYWRQTNPPLDGCKAPDWFYVPGVPAMLDGDYRRSYVLWQEVIHPQIVMEYVSGDGKEERDRTPFKGKFWVYEVAIMATYYVIFDGKVPLIEMHKMVEGRYVQVMPNKAGRYPIETLGIELGIWQGKYAEMELPWLRAWDSVSGEMLPSLVERAETAESIAEDLGRELAEECERAEAERKRADQADQRAARLAERLRALGVDPDAA